MKDYYRTLGILDDAEDIIIKAAYRALAQRYHPDKWSGNQDEATKRMAEINEAYSVLSDTSRRKKYDEEFFKFKSRNEDTDEPSENFDEEELDEEAPVYGVLKPVNTWNPVLINFQHAYHLIQDAYNTRSIKLNE